MKMAISLRAISIIVFPAMIGLALACGAPPPSATAPRPADTVTPTVTASIPAGQTTTEAPANLPTLPPAETPEATPELPASAVPTATTQPSPTPPVQPTATSAPTPESKPGPTAVPTPDPSMVPAEIVDFILPDITIPAGATVIWTNLDEEGHTTTSGKDGISARFDDIAWNSRGLDLGESFSVTFALPGVFPYTCVFHPWMNAIVTVEASSSGQTSGAGGGSSGSGDPGY